MFMLALLKRGVQAGQRGPALRAGRKVALAAAESAFAVSSRHGAFRPGTGFIHHERAVPEF